jgi:aspartate-semialdehyde dehydrogenase
MVGSVLMGRMRAEGDFDGLDTAFFSTSSPGRLGPDVGQGAASLLDAYNTETLASFDVLLTCQGGEYTKAVYPQLRAMGWKGHWIDAASALRMDSETSLVLDPLNLQGIDAALSAGCRTFAGANCTVSLLLLGLQGLIESGHVEWISTMTYQAASGAGAANLKELVAQMQVLGDAGRSLLGDPGSAALALDQVVADSLSDASFPVDHFGAPLAASAIPWIDRLVEGGQTREEWKAMAEANKLLGRDADPLPIDGLCVRIGAMRCHAQAVTIKLDSDVPLDEISAMLDEAHPWSGVVPNTKASTLVGLTPAAVAGTLQVPVGRLRKMNLGPQFVTAFTVGDQLLWGAAEPLRRMLEILRTRSL